MSFTLHILALTTSSLPTSLPHADPLIPLAPSWITGFLLLILWLTVAAIILGPLIKHFRLEPRSEQFFTGDRPNSAPRRI